MNLSQIRQTGKPHLVPRERVIHDGPWLAELKDRGGKAMATGASKPTGLFLVSWCLASGAELAWWREQGLGIRRSEVSHLQVQRWGLSRRAGEGEAGKPPLTTWPPQARHMLGKGRVTGSFGMGLSSFSSQ